MPMLPFSRDKTPTRVKYFHLRVVRRGLGILIRGASIGIILLCFVLL